MTESHGLRENAPNAFRASEFTVNVKFEDLPGPVVEMAKKCFLDFLAIALASEKVPAVGSGMGLLNALGQSEDDVLTLAWLRRSLGSTGLI